MNHYVVTVDGDNENSGMALDDAFRDIVHAVGELDDGATLSIGDGVYHEQVVIDDKTASSSVGARDSRPSSTGASLPSAMLARRGLEPRRHARRVRVHSPGVGAGTG